MDLRQRLFQYRSYSPLPFLVAMVFFAKPNLASLLAGFCVILIGEWLRLWGVAIAGSETRTTGPVGGTFLITTGPFSYVRNPLYVGNIIIYTGVGIMSNALVPWLTLIALLYFIWQYSMIVSLEEEHLKEKFGEEYQRYCALVPRFIPSLTSYNPGANEQPSLEWKRGIVSEKRTIQAIVLLSLLLLVIYVVRD